MSAAKHVFSTSKFDVGEYTYIKTTEYNDLCMKLDRANAEAEAEERVREVTRRLQICDEHYDELAESWAELRQISEKRAEQYKQLWAEWTKLCGEWVELRTENKKLRTELAARNPPTTAQGTQTTESISSQAQNVYRVTAG